VAAALAAGLTLVPVRVFDADRDTVERLRIEENLRRRILKPSEQARAIKRWYELKGISGQGARTDLSAGLTSASDLAQDMGISRQTITVYRTLAELIPALSRLLDHGAPTHNKRPELERSSSGRLARLQAVLWPVMRVDRVMAHGIVHQEDDRAADQGDDQDDRQQPPLPVHGPLPPFISHG
jgi:hypothetical protein